MTVSRRSFLQGVGLGGAAVRIGLASAGRDVQLAAAPRTPRRRRTARKPIESRFVLWFNGNGILENYWIPRETGSDYEITPCLKPLAPFRNDIHVISGLDNPNGNGHHGAMSSLMSGTAFTGRGAGGPSIDQVIAQQDRQRLALPLAADRRVPGIVRREHPAQHELGRARPPAAARDDSAPSVRPSLRRQGPGLDRSQEERARPRARGRRRVQQRASARTTRSRVDEYLTSVRTRRALHRQPAAGVRDGSRASRRHAATCATGRASPSSSPICWCTRSLRGQTRVASYMLTKCQSLTRFPWLGHTTLRHHDYTHTRANTPKASASCATSAAGTSRSSPTCWAS